MFKLWQKLVWLRGLGKFSLLLGGVGLLVVSCNQRSD